MDLDNKDFYHRRHIPIGLFSSVQKNDADFGFSRGDPVQVEVVRFGKLGASVDVISRSHDEDDIIADDEEALATGLILQREIKYFREARGFDVVTGEILPAFVENVRELPVMKGGSIVPDQFRKSLDICLRPVGGAAKAQALSDVIMEKLLGSPDGYILVGDKSHPEDIAKLFPGSSKGAFKKAVSLLFKEGKVVPSPDRTTLVQK